MSTARKVRFPRKQRLRMPKGWSDPGAIKLLRLFERALDEGRSFAFRTDGAGIEVSIGARPTPTDVAISRFQEAMTKRGRK